MKRTATATLLTTAFLLAACARGSSGAVDSGIDGKVLMGPTCPVQTLESPCPDRPVAAPLEIKQNGEVVQEIRSLDDGTFKVNLPPGDYVVAPVQPSSGTVPRAAPVTVTVRAHQYAKVTIAFDTGIR